MRLGARFQGAELERTLEEVRVGRTHLDPREVYLVLAELRSLREDLERATSATSASTAASAPGVS